MAVNRKIINSALETITKWQLFDLNERILVGVSGGKDSLALLDCLFLSGCTNLHSIHVRIDTSAPLLFEKFCRERSDFTVIETDILHKVLSSKRKNTCYMCSREKRKVISAYAMENGFSKLALAHHKDDAIETLLLNLIFQRELSTMMPKQALFDGRMELVRPFYETAEKDIFRFARAAELPVSDWKCGFETDTRRTWIKEQIKLWQRTYPKQRIAENIFKAMLNVNTEFLP